MADPTPITSIVTVGDDDSRRRTRAPKMMTVCGVSMPMAVWRDIALGVKGLESRDIDQLQIWRKSRRIIVKEMNISK